LVFQLVYAKILHQKNHRNFIHFQLSFRMPITSYQPSLQPIHLVITFKILILRVHQKDHFSLMKEERLIHQVLSFPHQKVLLEAPLELHFEVVFKLVEGYQTLCSNPYLHHLKRQAFEQVFKKEVSGQMLIVFKEAQ